MVEKKDSAASDVSYSALSDGKLVRFFGSVWKRTSGFIGPPLLRLRPRASSPHSRSRRRADSGATLSSTSKGDGWTSLLRAQLTASHFSLVREEQLPGGESIFISPRAGGSWRDIKGDSAGDRGAGPGAEDPKKKDPRLSQIWEQKTEKRLRDYKEGVKAVEESRSDGHEG